MFSSGMIRERVQEWEDGMGFGSRCPRNVRGGDLYFELHTGLTPSPRRSTYMC